MFSLRIREAMALPCPSTAWLAGRTRMEREPRSAPVRAVADCRLSGAAFHCGGEEQSHSLARPPLRALIQHTALDCCAMFACQNRRAHDVFQRCIFHKNLFSASMETHLSSRRLSSLPGLDRAIFFPVSSSGESASATGARSQQPVGWRSGCRRLSRPHTLF